MQIKPIASVRHLRLLLVAASLGACSLPPGAPVHARHHPGQVDNATTSVASTASAAQGGAMMHGAMAGSGPGCPMMGGKTDRRCGMPDKQAMCTLHHQMHNAPNEEARQAMMERHMPGLSPQMRRQHIDRMRQQCQ